MTEDHSNLPTEQSSEEVLFGVSDDIVQQVASDLDEQRHQEILTQVESLHAADIADLIRALPTEYKEPFVKLTKQFISPDVLAELEEDPVLPIVFEILGTRRLATALSDMNSDDAFHVIQELEDDQKRKVLEKISPGERALFEESLSYPEDSAGRLMQREIVCVPAFWNVGEALSFIRDSEGLPKNYYNIYVVNPKHHPIGEIPLSYLLSHPLDKSVSEIMDTDIHPIPVATDQEEVAQSFKHYARVSAPVVDANTRIVGMITVDDVVEVIEEEVEEDIMHMAKVSESDFYNPVMSTVYMRVRWLVITLVNSLLAAYVISQFEESIDKITALSFLMTINAAMGGNSGMQVVTVVVRALATRSMRDGDTWRAVRKELSVGFCIGSIFSVTLGVIAAFWVMDVSMGIILAVALMCNMLWAAFAGTLLPILVHRMGLDPAISAGPILTTTTDVFGYAIFLGLATIILL